MEYSITLASFRRIEPFEETLSKMSATGLDSVEMFGEPEAAGEIKDLKSSGVRVCGVTGMWGATSEKSSARRLLSSDRGMAEAASDYVKECVKMCSFLGGKLFNVCLFSDSETVDRTHGLPSDNEKARMASRAAGVLEALVRFAADHGVTLVLEPLNRYSTPYCCSAKDVLQVVMKLGQTESLGILLDTFHMNIEEDSFEAAISATAGLLHHMHFADNNRKMPGFGHINFPEIAGALRKIGYDKQVCFEPNFHSSQYQSDLKKGLDYIKSLI